MTIEDIRKEFIGKKVRREFEEDRSGAYAKNGHIHWQEDVEEFFEEEFDVDDVRDEFEEWYREEYLDGEVDEDETGEEEELDYDEAEFMQWIYDEYGWDVDDPGDYRTVNVMLDAFYAVDDNDAITRIDDIEKQGLLGEDVRGGTYVAYDPEDADYDSLYDFLDRMTGAVN